MMQVDRDALIRGIVKPGDLTAMLRYEPDTGKLFWRARRDMRDCWNTRYAGKEAFTSLSHGHMQGCIHGRTYWAHRVIWAIQTGEWPPIQIDHINGIRTDNRWSNLRLASPIDNACNKASLAGSSSCFLGVSFNKRLSKWTAQIQRNGRQQFLGTFQSEGAAARSYDAAAVRLHGEFARLNFPVTP